MRLTSRHCDAKRSMHMSGCRQRPHRQWNTLARSCPHRWHLKRSRTTARSDTALLQTRCARQTQLHSRTSCQLGYAFNLLCLASRRASSRSHRHAPDILIAPCFRLLRYSGGDTATLYLGARVYTCKQESTPCPGNYIGAIFHGLSRPLQLCTHSSGKINRKLCKLCMSVTHQS